MARKKEESIHNRIRYTGQQYDQITGQYYLRARFYNPVVGRFLQEDEYHGDGLNLYAYYQNKTYSVALKNKGFSTSYEGSSFQSHHMLQGQWANTNLKEYGYNYGKAPTISLGTGYYTDGDGKQAVAPHTIVNNSQTDRTRDRGGDYSSTLNSELVFGATDLLKGGMSESVAMSELERNYKMIDSLNEQNKDKILRGELDGLQYARKAIEGAVHEVKENKDECVKSEKC